jgi:hypothetical protein
MKAVVIACILVLVLANVVLSQMSNETTAAPTMATTTPKASMATQAYATASLTIAALVSSCLYLMSN